MNARMTNGDVFLPFSQSLLTTRTSKLYVAGIPLLTGAHPRQTQGRRKRKRHRHRMPHGQGKAKKVQDSPLILCCLTHGFNPAQLVEQKGMEVDTIAMIKKNSTKIPMEPLNW